MRVIAIDGPAGSGKSTVARALATRLGLDYLDTGAMYRAVAFAALRRGIDPEEVATIARLAEQVEIDISDLVVVDGVDATIEIRGPEVTRAVSAVAANPAVRTELRRRQREWADAHGGGVIEGRDIGSVVFPQAELKVYLTASDSERAVRRSKEVLDMDYDTVAADIARRDHADCNRPTAPLTIAEGAVTVDTTGSSVDEVVDEVMALLPSALADPAQIETTEPAVPEPASPEPASPEPAGPANLGRGRLLFAFVVRAVVCIFCHGFWRVRIEGRSNIPSDGPFILAPIHRSNIDTPLMACITWRRLRFMGKDSLWRYGWSAWFFTTMGGFPVHREGVDRDALRRCEAALRNGFPVVIFPEGTRRSAAAVEALFDGAAFVSVRCGAPIVPVGIGGSARAMPVGAKSLHPVKIRIVIGAPMHPPPRPVGGTRGSRRQVRELTAQLTVELQRLYDLAGH